MTAAILTVDDDTDLQEMLQIFLKAAGLAKELHLLLTLAQNQKKVYHPRMLYELIWNDQSGYSSETIKVHISKLRKKIEADPIHPKYIQTVKGFGYKFEMSG